MRLYISIFCLVFTASCDDGFNDDLQGFSGGGQKKEPVNQGDANPNTQFTTGNPETVIRTSGLFGDANDSEIGLPALGIKATKRDSDQTESETEIKVENAEKFDIVWDSRHVENCTVTAESLEGVPDERFNFTTPQGKEEIYKLKFDTKFTAECDAQYRDEKLSDSVIVKVDGGWYAVPGNLSNAMKECSNFCANHQEAGKPAGLFNSSSPDGAKCISGEARAGSSIGLAISSNYGCWGSGCSQDTEQRSNAFSEGHRCYRPSQKRDHDRTDNTIGCYCIRTTL